MGNHAETHRKRTVMRTTMIYGVRHGAEQAHEASLLDVLGLATSTHTNTGATTVAFS